jgi:hypothetical protein
VTKTATLVYLTLLLSEPRTKIMVAITRRLIDHVMNTRAQLPGYRWGFLRNDGDFCHQGRDTEIAQRHKIVETYCVLTMSDGTINCIITFWECIFRIFLKRQSLTS